MDIFQIALILATFLCSVVGGFLMAFSIVVMPGIKNLNDGEFIRAFQAIDRVIQNGQALFMIFWVGSIIALVITAVLAVGELDTIGWIFMTLAVSTYLIGVQLPTIRINIPLNNILQTLNVDEMDDAEQQMARTNFEAKWVKWNVIRTAFSNITALLLILLLFLQ
ncbi:DUF1772 domain-containing protein [Gracilimonas sediminicola]|uniref:DUF1772 domain-containing protein n=1 Tax=Gracilimonas sediminicola TaxID=2952158 RepID=A0A9X2L487_9BACT|nr:DUF1772 domain-containing protein [Gracilimonas sediminicola]MCP9291964.1 DUF1772 domain-containing protein [Gracilimonas sediminicola]